MRQRGRDSRAAPARWPLPVVGTSGRSVAVWRWLRRVLLAAGLLALLAVGAAGFAWWHLAATVTSYAPAHFNQGTNAVWLEHSWSGEPHTPAQYDQLAAQLQREQIRYVFAHVGPLQSDGVIQTSLAPYADKLAVALHARVPGIRVLAWIGQLEAASGAPADTVVNLGKSVVRQQIVRTSASFVARGLDGVHYDIEPILNNNARFLDLLDETRAALPAGSVISVAAQKWAPSARVAQWAYQTGHADAWWTTYYYAQVAAHVDQMVVMAYNTAMPTAGLYELMVKQETQHILEAVRTTSHPPQVLIGLPTYPGDETWFHASAENMDSGLLGVSGGLNANRTAAPFAGVAIYRLGTTSTSSWQTYQRLWLGQP